MERSRGGRASRIIVAALIGAAIFSAALFAYWPARDYAFVNYDATIRAQPDHAGAAQALLELNGSKAL